MGGFTTDDMRLLAVAYLRLMAQGADGVGCVRESKPEESIPKPSERLDFRSGIAMTCAGQDDDNPLAGKDLKDGK